MVAARTSGARAFLAGLRFLQRLRGGCSVVMTALGALSGGLFLLLAFYITLDATSRYLFGVSTRVSDELSGYALAIGGTWALAYALQAGGHVTLAVLSDYYPRTVRVALEVVALAVLALGSLGVTVLTWQLALESHGMGARHMGILSTPLVIPQAGLAFGFTLLTVQASVMLLAQIADIILSGGTAARAPGAPEPDARV